MLFCLLYFISLNKLYYFVSFCFVLFSFESWKGLFRDHEIPRTGLLFCEITKLVSLSHPLSDKYREGNITGNPTHLLLNMSGLLVGQLWVAHLQVTGGWLTCRVLVSGSLQDIGEWLTCRTCCRDEDLGWSPGYRTHSAGHTPLLTHKITLISFTNMAKKSFNKIIFSRILLDERQIIHSVLEIKLNSTEYF
jgi:hypothetical protein